MLDMLWNRVHVCECELIVEYSITYPLSDRAAFEVKNPPALDESMDVVDIPRLAVMALQYVL